MVFVAWLITGDIYRCVPTNEVIWLTMDYFDQSSCEGIGYRRTQCREQYRSLLVALIA